MKSGISFFDRAVVRKDITRFAPAWGLYTVGLMMFMVVFAGMENGVRYARSVADTMSGMAPVNFFYALLCAQLLFGDLYNSRMCNALHAMPLRRETWFGSHVLSGLLFSLVPNLLLTLINLPLCGGLWQVPLLWLAVATMQYLFFFGAAVLAALCVGNRFAMALVYGIFNGFALIALGLVDTLFMPVLYGVVLREDAFFRFSPVVQMTANSYLNVDIYSAFISASHVRGVELEFVEGWGYLGICAALGIGLGVLGLLLYRRRNLECAGDFVSVKWLSPVFLIIYTLCAGACCHGFFDLVVGEEAFGFLLLGFAIGFFTGLMLLKRRVRVFGKRNLAYFAAFLAAFGAVFLLVRLDPVGITRWVPKAEQVKSVRIHTGASLHYVEDMGSLDREDQIRDMLEIHAYAVENPDQQWNSSTDIRLFLTYQLKSGRTVEREYYMDMDSPVGELMRKYLSSPEFVLGEIYTKNLRVEQVELPDPETALTDPEEIQKLLAAIVADCEAGNMPQDWNYLHDKQNHCWLILEFRLSDKGLLYNRDIRFTEDAENLMAWMQEHNIQPEKWK